MVRFRPFVSAVAAALVALACVPSAYAAPTPWEAVDITLHGEQAGSIMIISGLLPDSAKLPADVQLSAPTGSQVQWLGEILGGDMADDIEAQYTTSTANGSDNYSFTLTKARTGQVEVLAPNAMLYDGTTYTTKVNWTPPFDIKAVRMTARVPANAQVTTASADTTTFPGDAQYSYHSRIFENVKAGEPLELALSYTVPAGAAPGQPAAAAGGGNGIVLPLVLLGAIVAFGVAVIAIRKKMTPGAGVDEGDDDDEVAADDADADSATDDEPAAEADTDSDSAEDAEADAVATPRRSRAPLVIAGVVVAGIAVFGVVATTQGSRGVEVGGSISRTYGSAEACTQANIAIAPAAGVDLKESSDEILAAFESLVGLSTVTLYPAEQRIEIGYCDSSATEDQLKQALTATGLVTIAAQ